MREPLTIAVAQPVCRPGDVAANVAAHAEAIRSAAARLVVFPELSLTGYDLGAPTLALDDPRLAPIVDACRDTGSVALVGAPVDGAPGEDHIAMLAVDGTGVRVAYRKMWLGSTETARFTAGTEPAVLELDGWRLGLAICKDAGVPQHWADTAALGIDAYVAGSVKAADESRAPGRARPPRRDRARDLGRGGQRRGLERWRLRPGGRSFGDLGRRRLGRRAGGRRSPARSRARRCAS